MQTRSISEFNDELRIKGFDVFPQQEGGKIATRIYSRKEFYKICLTTGKNIVHYADRTFEEEGTILFFGNPLIPYCWETISNDEMGFVCLFSIDFFEAVNRNESLQNSPLFKLGGTPIVLLDESKKDFLNGIFLKMQEEQQSDYTYKADLIRNYIQLIIHEALKLQPSTHFDHQKNASSRLTSIFLELLKRQFPIEKAECPLQLTSAQAYASYLNVHVNYLNRSVKQITGKTTTILITERIISEAKALLQHTDWNISEIAFALGFDSPSYFNTIFKKMTTQSPRDYRIAKFEI